jgi:Type ISP C-terminal specificity domain
MPFHQQGIKTHRDWLVIDYEDTEIKSRIEFLRSHTEEEILGAYNLSESYRTAVSGAIKKVKALPPVRQDALVDYLYRPFDNRRLYYDPILIDRHRPDLARQYGTIFLITRRNSRQWTTNWSFAFVTKNLPDNDMRGGVYAFPMKVDSAPNFSRGFLDAISKFIPQPISPFDILGYIYAILYCNEYRKKYSEDLRLSFPRIPVAANQDLFLETSNIGKTLIRYHLLENLESNKLDAGFPEGGTDFIKKVEYNPSECSVYVNEKQYFSNLSLEIWNYQIGGYRVCHRWLKERLGRRLRSSDQIIFMRIVGSIGKTIELQRKIDHIYPAIESQTLQISLSNHNTNETLI